MTVELNDSECQETEKPWTDNRIRWKEDDNSLPPPEEEEDAGFLDPFQEDPHQVFSFSFGNGIEQPHTNVELQGYKYESDPIWRSTGLTLWRAAEYLSEYIAAEASSFVHDKSILELGAGLGLCGIVAHRVGNANTTIVLTDGDTDALVKLRENVALNKAEEGGRISCQQLLWGKESAESFLKSQNGLFDVVLASDVIYVPDVVEPLFATVRTLLSQEGCFILAYKKRDVPVTNEMVLNAAAEAGFGYTTPVLDTPEGLFLYVFRRQEQIA